MNIESEALAFLERLFVEVDQHQLTFCGLEIDHLCYRTESIEDYENVKNDFSQLGVLLIESKVNGRLIATYKLKTPIIFRDWFIDLVEVPAPKTGKKTPRGFEHIEVVIEESFKDWQEKHPHLHYQTKGMSKILNPELEIEFKNGAIKLHHLSLENIINIEQNNEVIAFLESSHLLEQLSAFSPMLSGSMPLNIHTSRSDIDFLFQVDDSSKFEAVMTQLFGKELSRDEKIFQGILSRIYRIEQGKLKIELFAQNLSVFQQQSHQHMLIENRLLKILGNNFKKEIIKLKQSGLKTEEAFGKLLNLPSPNQNLLELKKLTDIEIHAKFRHGN